MKKKLAVILMLVLALCCFAACGGEKEADDGVKSVTFSLLGSPESLDPATTTSGASLMVEIQMYNTLVYSDGGMVSSDIRPELATDWTISDDGLTYTFNLRNDVYFHNGEKFTAADAKYTFDRVMVEPYTSYLTVMIKDTVVVDEDTFQVNLLYPSADFLPMCGMIYFAIVNEKAITSSETFMYEPVGTGPYMLADKFVPGQGFKFVYNENYWGAEPDIKEINFEIYPDTNTAVIALQNGEIDFAPALTVNDVAIVEADKDLKLYQEPSYTINYLTMNKNGAPYNNDLVRDAINHAINKEDLLLGAVDGVGEIANSPLNSLMLGYTEDIPFNEYDLDKAKQLMIDAGYPDGFSCNLLVNSSNATSMKLAQIIQYQLAQIGIDVFVDQQEKATWSSNLSNSNFEIALGTLNWPDSNNMVTYLYHTQGTFNYDRAYSNPEMDALIEQASQELDTAKRADLYEQIVKLGHEDLPIICLLFPNEIVGANAKIDGIKIFDNTYFPVYYWTLNE